MNKSHLARLFLFCTPFLFLACSKKVSNVTTNVAPKPTLNIEEIDFEYFQGKARMVLRDGNNEREVKSNIRIRKDSVIWMNFSVIGVQVGKALINKDSITILGDKEYFVFDYAELTKRFNFEISYDVIQAAMLGNLIMKKKDTDKVEQLSSMFLLKQQSATIDVVNYVNAASMKLEKIELKENDTNNSLTINYSNFQPVGDKVFPYNGVIVLFYKTLNGLLNTTIIFEYSKAEVGDKELKFPFNIPKRYDRR